MVYVISAVLIFGANNPVLFLITETQCSSLARSEAVTQKDSISDSTINAKTEAGNQQGPVSNGVAKSIVIPTAKTSQMVTTTVAAAPSNDHQKLQPFPENGNSRPKD